MGKNVFTITANGETHTLSEWAKITGMARGTIRARLMGGWTPEQALSEPVRSWGMVQPRRISPDLRDFKENPRHVDANGDAHRKYTDYGNVNVPRAWMADIGVFFNDPVLVRRCGDHIEVWPCER